MEIIIAAIIVSAITASITAWAIVRNSEKPLAPERKSSADSIEPTGSNDCDWMPERPTR